MRCQIFAIFRSWLFLQRPRRDARLSSAVLLSICVVVDTRRIALLTSSGVECAFPLPVDAVCSAHVRPNQLTGVSFVLLWSPTAAATTAATAASPCDAWSSAVCSSSSSTDAADRRRRSGLAVPGTTVMYRRSPEGPNPAPSFIVHLLSRNEPFGTRTVATPLVLCVVRQYCSSALTETVDLSLV